MSLLIIFVALAIGVSFLCSILEAVLLSITPSFVEASETESPKLAKKLRGLRSDIERPLAAILSLNTIAHTVGATGAGAQAAIVFEDAGVGIFSAVLTLAILVLSEIIPKTLGATYWRALAPFTVKVLPWLIIVQLPLVWLS
ncbi:MAG: CNNM domain-containing protein, partial [Pseudomonadota bacterium]